jgi:hypothetical protein
VSARPLVRRSERKATFRSLMNDIILLFPSGSQSRQRYGQLVNI